MKEEYTEKFMSDFPKLFFKEHLFDFSCGDGWFQLLYNLSQQINSLLDQLPPKTIYPVQIKEKFGGLRFNINVICEKNIKAQEVINNIYILIHDAECKSNTICELCGEQGLTLNVNGWYRTLCDKHVPCKGREGLPKKS